MPALRYRKNGAIYLAAGIIRRKIMGTIARMILILTLFVLGTGIGLHAQSGTSNGSKEKDEAPLKKVEPIFPDENKYLIFFEGEDAVSTNFNKEPTQNYACSGSRALQLSRTTTVQAGTTFYADYVFYIEEDGTYEFWYGGTPPGPKSDIYPSYASPFQYSIDDASKTKNVYREDMTVVENYAPSYYWNLVKEENLTRGRHQLHIAVKDKRGYDARFYFYLDALFFVKKEGSSRLTGNKLPAIFPKNLDERKINQPFKQIDDYLILIRDNPEAVAPLVDVSLIYSLINDHLNAVKYLKRASMFAPDDINIKLLLAKNYVWMQEVSTGLDLYKEILKKDQSQINIWMEAGKVAGWTGRFKDSTEFFTQGLQSHPDNLDLLVNMGLSYLWAGDHVKADKAIQEAREKAGKDPDKIKALAKVFMVNGYPEKAAEIYKQGIEIAPADLQLYLLLEDTYLNSGKKTDADDVKNLISKRFIASSKLTRYLDLYHEKIGLKDKVLEGYRTQLVSQPDNLELREMLAQTYFWNGLRDDAIREYLNILTNQAFRELKSMEQGSSQVLEEIDRLSLLSDYYGGIEKIVTDKKNEINAQADKYRNAPVDKQKQEAALLSSLAADGEEMANRYNQISVIYKKELESVAAIMEKAKKDEEVGQKVMKSIRWEWDKRETVSELEEVSKNGLVLADHMLARISGLDNNFQDSRAKFEKIVKANPYPEAEFSLWETLLWSGNSDAADQMLSVYKKDMQGYMPYIESISSLADLTGKVTGSTADSSGDPSAKAKLVADRLLTLTSNARPNQQNADSSARLLREKLQNKLVFALYTCQENTYLLRNELGDFYLKNNEQDRAIAQYKQVLAIDPYNLSAIYKLGTVYQWKQDWYEAMSSFDKVYQADPNYENAASLYNSLAKAHADEVYLEADSYTDTSRFWMYALLNYRKYINSFMRGVIAYRYDYEQFYRTWLTPTFDSFFVHTVGAGMEFAVPVLNLKLIPVAGLRLYLKDDFYGWEMHQIDATQAAIYTNAYPDLSLLANYGLFNALSYDPWLELDFSLNAGDLFSSWGHFGFTKYLDSYAYHIADVYDLWTDANLSLAFSFLGAYPYKEGFVKLCPETHVLSDKNIIIKPNLELYMPIFSIDNPNIVLSFDGTGDFENTFNSAGGAIIPANYYKPNKVIQALGQLGISCKFGPKDKPDTPTFSLKAGGGYYGYINWLGNQINDTKFIGEGKFAIDGDKGSFSILADLNFTFMPNMTNLDFWSVEVKAEYTAKLPSLLAP
jgi:tetratricopeptide (TPR) repeat protein